MDRKINRRDGLGIQCPACQAVYFLEGGKNRDRIYYRDQDGTRCWKLLCICGEQTVFRKDNVALYETTATALEMGYAVRGECDRSSTDVMRGILMRVAGGVTAFSEAPGLRAREYSLVILEQIKKTEKGRH